jgi:hypothetical protein
MLWGRAVRDKRATSVRPTRKRRRRYRAEQPTGGIVQGGRRTGGSALPVVRDFDQRVTSGSLCCAETRDVSLSAEAVTDRSPRIISISAGDLHGRHLASAGERYHATCRMPVFWIFLFANSAIPAAASARL